MIRRLIPLLALLAMACSIPGTALARDVYATVSSSSAHVYQYAYASSKHIPVKKGTVVAVEEISHGWARVSRNGHTGYMKLSALSRASKRTSWKQRVKIYDWFREGHAILGEGSYGFVYDVKTGYVIKVKRLGGHNHMDLEPVSEKDSAKLKQIGASWDAWPVILYANGKFAACSINTKPHGNQSIKGNGFNGQFCLHMMGSKTHGGNAVREDHQSAIRTAYRWAHK